MVRSALLFPQTQVQYFECFLGGAINLFLKCPLDDEFLLCYTLLKRTGKRLTMEYETDGLCWGTFLLMKRACQFPRLWCAYNSHSLLLAWLPSPSLSACIFKAGPIRGKLQVEELHCLMIWWSLKHGHWPNLLMHRALRLAYKHTFERINCKACLMEGKSLFLKHHKWDASFTSWNAFLRGNASRAMPQRLFIVIQHRKCHSAYIWAFSYGLADFWRNKVVGRKHCKLSCQVHVFSSMWICIYSVIKSRGLLSTTGGGIFC